MIELRHVSKTYPSGVGAQEIVAIRDLSLKVSEGETVALIGPSGCGKTTTMKLVNRLVTADRGEVRFAEKNVDTWDPIRLRRSIGYVVQSGGLFPHMTVRANIGLLARLEKRDSKWVHSRVDELLELVNLKPADFGSRYPRELSGGQRQRVSVARSLVLDPPCILMDEPFGALDPITRNQLHEEFLRLRSGVKKTVVLVTHDMSEAFRLADRVALMDRGEIVQIGDEASYRAQPASDFVRRFLQTHLMSHDA